jgi:hypothetical protein
VEIWWNMVALLREKIVGYPHNWFLISQIVDWLVRYPSGYYVETNSKKFWLRREKIHLY